MLLAKAPSTMETVNDLDGRLIYLDIARAVAMHLLRWTIAAFLAPISPYRLSPTVTGLNRGDRYTGNLVVATVSSSGVVPRFGSGAG